MKLSDITIGCDPEFAGFIANRRLNFRDILSSNGTFGWDHGGQVAELRPPAAKHARTIVRRLRSIMQDAPIAARVAKWRAGAFVSNPATALGGHIHLGLSPSIHQESLKSLSKFTETLFALDILPDEENKCRQNGSDYGSLDDYRIAYFKDAFVFEYRAMCSWLFDPNVTMLALTGAKLAAFDPDFTLETFKPAKHSHKQLREFFEAFKSKNSDAQYVVEKILPKIKEANPDVDIQDAWELEKPKQASA